MSPGLQYAPRVRPHTFQNRLKDLLLKKDDLKLKKGNQKVKTKSERERTSETPQQIHKDLSILFRE